MPGCVKPCPGIFMIRSAGYEGVFAEMKHYGKKLIAMLLTLLGVSFIVFAAFEIIPGDPALSKLGDNATPEALAALRAQMGLDLPFLLRYLDWLGDCLKGNLGESYSYHMPEIRMIGDKLPITLTMTILSMLLTLLISVPAGVLLSKYAYLQEVILRDEDIYYRLRAMLT